MSSRPARTEAKLADPEPLRRRLEPLAERLADAERLRRERAASETAGARARRGSGAARSRGRRSRRARPRRRCRTTPSSPHSSQADQERAEARRWPRKELEKAARDVARPRRRSRSAQREAAGATRADWLAARERRERGFDRLGEALDGDAARRRERFEAMRTLTHAADAIGDAVVADTERAARLRDGARRPRRAPRGAEPRRARRRRRLAASAKPRRQNGGALWARSGVEPRRAGGDGALGRARRGADEAPRRACRSAAPRPRRSPAGWKRPQAACGNGLRRSASSRRPASSLPIARRARSSTLGRAPGMRPRKAADARANAARAALEAEAEAARRERELAELAAAWPAAMGGLEARGDGASAGSRGGARRLGRGRAAAPEHGARNPLDRGHRARPRRVRRGRRRARRRASRPNFASSAPRRPLLRLCDRLSEARRDRGRADAAGKIGGAARGAAPHARKRVGRRSRPTLAAACEKLGVADEAALALALERAEARRERRELRAQMLQQLGEAGDGLGEAALGAEQQTLDPALLGDEIAHWKARRAELLQALSEAARAVRDAEAEYEALARGRDAAGAARERDGGAGRASRHRRALAVRQAAAKTRRARDRTPPRRGARPAGRAAPASCFRSRPPTSSPSSRPTTTTPTARCSSRCAGTANASASRVLAKARATSCFSRCGWRCSSAAPASRCRSSATTSSRASTTSARG